MKVLLIVVYMSATNAIDMRNYTLADMTTCKAKAREIQANVKAGKVNTVCWSIK